MKIRSFLAAAIAACAALSAKADATLPFTEQFSANDGAWSSSSGTPSFDNSGWTYSSTCKSKSAIKIGTGSATGSATTPVIQLGAGWSQASITVTFQAAAWYGYSSGLTLSKIENGTTTEIDSWSVPKIADKKADSESIADLSDFSADSNGKDYSATFTVSGPFQLEFATTGSGDNRRSYLDTVVVVGEEISGGGDTPSGPTALATPTALVLVASSVTDSGFNLSWTGVEHADGYEVEVLDGDNLSAGSVSVSGTSATVTELVSDTAYTVHVKALAAAGSEDYADSAWSEAVHVTTTLADGLRRAEIFTEDFSTVEGPTTWKSSSYLATITGDRGDWTGEAIAKGKNTAISIGKASDTGYVISPIVQLANGVSASPVAISFDAASYSGKKASVQVSVIDADTMETISVVGKNSPAALADEAESVAAAGSSVVLSNVAVPARFRIRFDSLKDADDDYSRVWLDTILVTQVYDPNYATLAAPANVEVSDIGKESFTVSWDEVTGAVGYEVWVNGWNAASCEAGVSSAQITEISDGVEYEVLVRARGDGLHYGDSPFSEPVTATTLEDEQRIDFVVTDAPDGEVYAGDTVSFTVSAASAATGDPAEVSFSGIADATFDSATGAFSWTPSESDVGSHTATFTSGLYSTNVTISVVSATREETIFAEDFTSCESTWSGQGIPASGRTLDDYTDTDGWTGEHLYNGPSAIRLGNVTYQGWAQTPGIDLYGGAQSATVAVSFHALSNSESDHDELEVLVIGASGSTLATRNYVLVPRGAGTNDLSQASVDSDGNALSFSLSVSDAPFKLKFTPTTSKKWHVLIDSIRVTQTVSAKIKTLETPEALALADGTAAGESGFTVTWTPVDGATGYDVRVLDASGATAGSVSGEVSPEGTVWTGLADDTAYMVQVRATGDTETYYPSAWSEALPVTTERSALHPTLTLGAWQNEVGDGKLYASTANSAAVSATLGDGAPGTVTSIALSSLTPAQAEGATGPTLAGGTLAWTPAEADAKKSFTLAFAITVAPTEGEARTWTETVAVPVAALPALAAPANLAVDPETLDWNRADFTWTKPFRAVSYTLRVWSGAADPDASGTTWSEDFNSYLGTTETQPSGWTFENGDAAYKTYDGVHVGFKASGSVTSPEISGTVNSLSFNIRSVSGTTSTLSVLGWNGTEWVELGSYTGEGLSTSTSTKTIENLAGAYNRFKWEFSKVDSNCAFGSVVLTGTGLPVAKVRTVEIASGDTTAATVVPAAWGAVNYADITAHDADGASQTSDAIQFSVPEQPPSVRATVFVVR